MQLNTKSNLGDNQVDVTKVYESTNVLVHRKHFEWLQPRESDALFQMLSENFN